MTHMVLTLGQRFNEYEALGELFRATRREMFELTQWRRTLEIIKNLLNVLAVKLCINVANTMENLMQGTQAVSELEAILSALFYFERIKNFLVFFLCIETRTVLFRKISVPVNLAVVFAHQSKKKCVQ